MKKISQATDDGDAEQHRRQAGWMPLIAGGGRAMTAALKQLKEAYDKNMIGRCMRQFGLTQHEAEDVWQDVLVNLVKNAADFRADGGLAALIRTMVDNAARNELVKAWRSRRVELPDDDDPAALLTSNDERELEEDYRRCVQRGLAEFGRQYPEDFRLLTERDIEGLSIPELARALGRTEVATRTRLKVLRMKVTPFLEQCRHLLRS